MKIVMVLIVTILLVGLVVGCAGMTPTQQRTLSGAAIGAGAGAALSAITGNSIATGSAIGAGAGALGGYIYSKSRHGK